jgi:hypothetical protein
MSLVLHVGVPCFRKQRRADSPKCVEEEPAPILFLKQGGRSRAIVYPGARFGGVPQMTFQTMCLAPKEPRNKSTTLCLVGLSKNIKSNRVIRHSSTGAQKR